MIRKMCVLALVAGLSIAAFGVYSPQAGAEPVVIRMASLAPRGSSWDKIFKAWNKSLKDKTDGAVKFKFYPGGIAGDERDVIRKMKVGQMDAGGFTSIGLGQIVRPVTIMQMPGMFADYKTLNRVRKVMAPTWDGMFEKEGYKLLGWGDAGFGRIFSQRPILKPADYKSVRPWVPKDDPTMPQFMKNIGANGVSLGIPEVLPALQTGMVDTVAASAVAAVALQWFRHVTHMSSSSNLAIVGATIVRQETFDKLTPQAQEALVETGRKAHQVLIKRVEKEDNRAYKTLLKRGMKEYDPDQHIAAWQAENDKLMGQLTGQLWSKELFEQVKKAAAGK